MPQDVRELRRRAAQQQLCGELRGDVLGDEMRVDAFLEAPVGRAGARVWRAVDVERTEHAVGLEAEVTCGELCEAECDSVAQAVEEWGGRV